MAINVTHDHFRALFAEKPDSPSLMADMGIAYYARHTGPDRGKAYELLSQALAKTPEDPSLVFNRAIVAESVDFLDQAEADWKHYLQLESNGKWSDEARDRLKKLQEKKKNYNKGRSQSLLTPSELEGQSGSPQVEWLWMLALKNICTLPFRIGFPVPIPLMDEGADMAARAALSRLSRTMHSSHGDAWLEDLLANSRGQSFGAGVHALSAALANNDRGDYSAQPRQPLCCVGILCPRPGESSF